MDRSLPASSVLGIFQARVLECGAIGFSDQKGIEDKNNINKLSFLSLMGFFLFDLQASNDDSDDANGGGDGGDETASGNAGHQGERGLRTYQLEFNTRIILWLDVSTFFCSCYSITSRLWSLPNLQIHSILSSTAPGHAFSPPVKLYSLPSNDWYMLTLIIGEF